LGRVNAWLPDERDEFYGLSEAYREIQAAGRASGRQAFTVRLKNLLKECSEAKWMKLIFKHWPHQGLQRHPLKKI
jgi:hypothetical protein